MKITIDKYDFKYYISVDSYEGRIKTLNGFVNKKSTTVFSHIIWEKGAPDNEETIEHVVSLYFKEWALLNNNNEFVIEI